MSADRLVLAPGVAAAMRMEAARAYPEECCGALVGRDDGAARRVLRAVPLANVHDGGRQRRYLIDPGGLLRLVRQTDAEALAVVGFFHSHPDEAAEPSAHDGERAWPWYSYVIVPVRAGTAGTPRAWRLGADGAGFVEQTVETAVDHEGGADPAGSTSAAMTDTEERA